MKVGEYGNTLYFDTLFSMSGFTTISLTFTKPDGSSFSVNNNSTPPVTLGTVGICTPRGDFCPFQYVSYVFQLGQLNQAGEYTVQLNYRGSGGANLFSNVASFAVDPLNTPCCDCGC